MGGQIRGAAAAGGEGGRRGIRHRRCGDMGDTETKGNHEIKQHTTPTLTPYEYHYDYYDYHYYHYYHYTATYPIGIMSFLVG